MNRVCNIDKVFKVYFPIKKFNDKVEYKKLRYRFIQDDRSNVYVHKIDLLKLIGGKYTSHDILSFIDLYEYGNHRIGSSKIDYIKKYAVEKTCKLILLEEKDNQIANSILEWLNNLK